MYCILLDCSKTCEMKTKLSAIVNPKIETQTKDYHREFESLKS